MSIGSEGSGGGAGKDRYAELAALLRARREDLGLSRRALAESTGLSYPYIAQLEGGYRAPSVSSARKLALALHLPVEEIVHAADDAASPPPHGVTASAPGWMPNPSYSLSIATPLTDLRAPGTPTPPPEKAGEDDDAARPPRAPRVRLGATPELRTSAAATEVRRAYDVAKEIAAILRRLPPEDRLDALAFAQREVMSEIVAERTTRAHHGGEPGADAGR